MRIIDKTVTNKKGNKMTTLYVRGNIIWINFYVDGIRKQKSTKLPNTPENIKIVTDKIIPKLNIKIATGEIYKKKPNTFKYYGSIFLKQKEKDNNYKQVKRFYTKIENVFGDRKITDITRLDIKQYLMSLDITSPSKNPYKNVFNAVFELAVDDDVIATNPSLNIRLELNKKKKVEYYTKEEVKKLINASSGQLRAYLLIAFNTGMRTGEILGLQLGDFEESHISIKRTRTCGVVGQGKNYHAIRKVPYPSFILDEVKKIQGDNIFIFGNKDDSGKFRYKWDQCVERAGVKRLRLYCARHTFATLMLQDRIVSINELSGILGHISVKTTLDKYASVIDSATIDLGKDFSLFSGDVCDESVTFTKSESNKAL